MRPWEWRHTDRHTRTHTHRQTQTDFIICPMLYAIAMGQIKTKTWKINSLDSQCISSFNMLTRRHFYRPVHENVCRPLLENTTAQQMNQTFSLLSAVSGYVLVLKSQAWHIVKVLFLLPSESISGATHCRRALGFEIRSVCPSVCLIHVVCDKTNKPTKGHSPSFLVLIIWSAVYPSKICTLCQKCLTWTDFHS